MSQQKAKLRVCASCEWIFDKDDQHPEHGGCPKCGFGHYGARFVYGNACYRLAFTQKPWLDKKISNYTEELHDEIYKTNKNKKPKVWFRKIMPPPPVVFMEKD